MGEDMNQRHWWYPLDVALRRAQSFRARRAWIPILAAVVGALWIAADARTGRNASESEVVILYTNDFHSAIDPIPAYWVTETPGRQLGGAAQLMTLVERIRDRERAAGRPVFLFDSGDMFTGMLAKLTIGEAIMEMMTTLGYDAMAIGNHEFDYGWQNFRRQMFRVPFPVLGANITYRGARIPYARAHAIIEKDGLRIGAIGVIGQDARSTVLPSFVSELEFDEPAPAVAASVEELRSVVDLVVVLAHQGHTGPMQTDAEAHPEVQRDFEADIALSGRVRGIDVLVGGHAHRGIEPAYVHPETGTIIVQTYGYGTRLGYLRLRIDRRSRRVVAHDGELLKVWSDELPPHPRMAAKLTRYRELVAPQIGAVVGRAAVRLTRRYNAESLLGSFVSGVREGGVGDDAGVDDEAAVGVLVRDAGEAEQFGNFGGAERADLDELVEQGREAKDDVGFHADHDEPLLLPFAT
jgi:2',3'-cyclic-nucleotide 2'-phosphodiesterase (5'-nucleotidase family)